jgi:hypothetical protein
MAQETHRLTNQSFIAKEKRSLTLPLSVAQPLTRMQQLR